MKFIEIESPKEEKQPENDPREEGWVDWEDIPNGSIAIEKNGRRPTIKTDEGDFVGSHLVQVRRRGIAKGDKFKPIPESAITPMKIDREWYEKNIGPVE